VSEMSDENLALEKLIESAAWHSSVESQKIIHCEILKIFLD
jgi:hypothetical protein